MFPYGIRRDLLPAELRDAVIPFREDAELREFVRSCRESPHSLEEIARERELASRVPAFEAHGRLGMFPMHLLSRAQWGALVPLRLRGGALLDIGAGQGFVTEKARRLFSRIVATEVAPSLVERLRERGFEAYEADLATEEAPFPDEGFEVVSVLNVIDRCDRPYDLIARAAEHLRPGGLLILADPLPFSQQVRGIGLPGTPAQALPRAEGGSWEEHLSRFIEDALLPLGLRIRRVSRLPYLSKNSAERPIVAHDDFLVVCERT